MESPTSQAPGGEYGSSGMGASALAVGGSITGGIVKVVLLTLLLVFAGAGATITIFVIRLTKTRRRRAAFTPG
jgi:hypothetical protein